MTTKCLFVIMAFNSLILKFHPVFRVNFLYWGVISYHMLLIDGVRSGQTGKYLFDGHVVRALRPRARYFSVRPSYSVNKCNILFSEITKQMQEKNQRFCEHHLYARSNVPMAPRVLASGYVRTGVPSSCY